MNIPRLNSPQSERSDFWDEVLALNGSVTPFVRGRVLAFGVFGLAVWGVSEYLHVKTHLGVAPYEIIGVVLALLLVLRTNSGYDRWYEGRKLWGGIVNQSRNLGIIGAAYGPDDPQWRNDFLRWTSVFPHAARHSLRGERDLEDLKPLLDEEEVEELRESEHMGVYASMAVARLLTDAVQRGGMDRFAFLKAEEQRATLIDHIGACERILKTPLARVMSIKIRRFLMIYLILLPMALVDKCGALTPWLTMLVAYPLLSLDQIGIELENPFSPRRLSHLPLNKLSHDIQGNVMALAEEPAVSLASRHGVDSMTCA